MRNEHERRITPAELDLAQKKVLNDFFGLIRRLRRLSTSKLLEQQHSPTVAISPKTQVFQVFHFKVERLLSRIAESAVEIKKKPAVIDDSVAVYAELDPVVSGCQEVFSRHLSNWMREAAEVGRMEFFEALLTEVSFFDKDTERILVQDFTELLENRTPTKELSSEHQKLLYVTMLFISIIKRSDYRLFVRYVMKKDPKSEDALFFEEKIFGKKKTQLLREYKQQIIDRLSGQKEKRKRLEVPKLSEENIIALMRYRLILPDGGLNYPLLEVLNDENIVSDPEQTAEFPLPENFKSRT